MIAEIIFGLIASAIIWYLIFKIKLKMNKIDETKDIVKRIEKQDKKMIIGGKEIDLVAEIKKEQERNG